MKKLHYLLLTLIMLVMSFTVSASFNQLTMARLLSQTENLDKEVLEKALTAFYNARANNVTKSPLLTVIDYSRPSNEQRLWVFDLSRMKLLFEEWVSHGIGSGGLYAQKFSNKPRSRQSSLGLFKTGVTYHGGNGYSLRLEGLERDVNHLAKSRGIVIHGAHYSDPNILNRQKWLGRSHGCPAVSNKVSKKLINTIKNGSLVFIYYPDNLWLAESKFLQGNPRS